MLNKQVKQLTTSSLVSIISLSMLGLPAMAAAPAYWDPGAAQTTSPSASPYQTTTGAVPAPYAATTPPATQPAPAQPFANNPTLYAGVVTVPTGTRMSSSISSYISSDNAQVGDPVSATLGSDVSFGGQTVLPAGSYLQGQVVSVVPGRRLSRSGELQIRFNRAQTPDGRVYTISGRVATSDGSGVIKAGTSRVGKAAKNTIGGAALGAGLGALAGLIAGKSSTGNSRWDDYALRGAVLGGAAGVGKTAYDRGEDVVINPGTPIDVVLDQPLSVTPVTVAPAGGAYNPYAPQMAQPQTGYPAGAYPATPYPTQPANPYNPY